MLKSPVSDVLNDIEPYVAASGCKGWNIVEKYDISTVGDVLTGFNNWFMHCNVVCHNWVHTFASGNVLRCINIGSAYFIGPIGVL